MGEVAAKAQGGTGRAHKAEGTTYEKLKGSIGCALPLSVALKTGQAFANLRAFTRL